MENENGTPPVCPHCDNHYLTPEALSERISISVATLRVWRSRGGGPPAARIGKHLRYRWGDVLEWMAGRTSTTYRDDDRGA